MSFRHSVYCLRRITICGEMYVSFSFVPFHHRKLLELFVLQFFRKIFALLLNSDRDFPIYKKRRVCLKDILRDYVELKKKKNPVIIPCLVYVCKLLGHFD